MPLHLAGIFIYSIIEHNNCRLNTKPFVANAKEIQHFVNYKKIADSLAVRK